MATNDHLERLAGRLKEAMQPEDVFKDLDSKNDLAVQVKSLYQQMSGTCHPDFYDGTSSEELAKTTYQQLVGWFSAANKKIETGHWGQVMPGFSLEDEIGFTTKTHIFQVGSPIVSGDCADIYHCRWGKVGAEPHNFGIAKVASSIADNGFIDNESNILQSIAEAAAKSDDLDHYLQYTALLIDQAKIKATGKAKHPRRANTLEFTPGFVTLAEVRAKYPKGLVPHHAAWIGNRLFEGLGFFHLVAGVVHGAILPEHVLVHPINHGAKLIDWCFAVKISDKQPISAVSADYEAWYPQEVLAKQRPGPGTDIMMAARCLIYVLGGDPVSGAMPSIVKPRMQKFLKSLLVEDLAARPSDAWQVRDQYRRMQLDVFGPPKYHLLEM